MISRSRISLAATLVGGALLVAASGLHAQTAPEIATARAFAVEGITLADQGKCKEAIEKLERAEKLFTAPTSLVRLGECQIQLGLLVVGTENLQRVARAQLAPNAPAAFKASQDRARRVLEKALPRIAHLVLSVKAPPGAKATVKVDGEAVPDAMLDADRLTDPGEHLIEASAPGARAAQQKVKLKEGARETVSLVLEIDPASVAPPPSASVSVVASASAPPVASSTPPPPPLPPSPARVEPATSSKVLPLVLLGVGAVGLGLGAVFGLSANSKEKTLETTCPGKTCPTSAQSDLDSAKSAATISTVAFGIGGAAALVGAGLLLFGGGESSPAPTTSFSFDPARRQVGLRGSF